MLVGTAVILALTGVVMIYSATRGWLALAGDDPHYFLKRQAVFMVIGLAVMAGFALFDYRRLEQVSTLPLRRHPAGPGGRAGHTRHGRGPSAGSRSVPSSCSLRSSPRWC